MPIIKTYVCGKCKQNHNDPKDFRRITVLVDNDLEREQVPGSHQRFHSQVGSLKSDIWCGNCIKETGISYDSKPQETPATTIEDIVREICQEEIQNQ